MTTEDKGLRERFVDSGLMAQMCCGGDYCNGHPHVVTTDEIIEFIREEKKKSYEEGVAAYYEKLYTLINNYVANHPTYNTPEGAELFDMMEQSLTPTDDITPKN